MTKERSYENLASYYGREPTKEEVEKHEKQHDEYMNSLKEHQRPEWKQ